MSRNATDNLMKFQSQLLLILLSIFLSPSISLADQYQRGYTTQRNCYKNEYREEYVPGTKKSPGYVNSYTDTIEVPCTLNSLNSVRSNNQRSHHKSYISDENLLSKRYTTTKRACIVGSATAGGILGGGLAALLSKKDAYGWSVPLGAVLGMGVANSDC